MPRGLHLDRIQNPVGICGFARAPALRFDIPGNTTFNVKTSAGLQLRTHFRVVRCIDDCIYVHMTGEVRRQLSAIARQNVEDAAR